MAQPDNTSTTDTQALTSPQVVAQFDSGLKQIAESLVAIRDGFSSIEKDLEAIPGAQAVVFSRDWKDLRQKFTPIDETFRGTSTVLRIFLEAFETTVLTPASRFVENSSDRESKGEAEDEVDFVLSKSTDVGRDSGKLVKDYSHFRELILAFEKKFTVFAEKNKKRSDQGLEDLSLELKGIQAQRVEITKKITATITKAREDKEKFGIYSWILKLPLLNLLNVLLWLHVDSQLEKDLKLLKDQYEELTEQILRLKAKIAAYTGNTDNLDLILAKLSSLTETRLADVSSGVEIFNEVWQAGDSDLRAVQTYLASPSDTKVPTVLTVYQQTKRSVYNGIKSALGNFSLS